VISFPFACDDDVIDVGEYVSANLVHEYRLYEVGESGPGIFEAFRHPHKTIGVEGVMKLAFDLSSSLRNI
jgi:hypothetical protein